ncbi:MAG: hypothetical protein AB7F64_04135 [Gammaproteobacteria bacterium]
MQTRMLTPINWDSQFDLLNRKRIRAQQNKLSTNATFGLKSLETKNKTHLLKLIDLYNNAFSEFPVSYHDMKVLKPVSEANKDARSKLHAGHLKQCVHQIKLLHESEAYQNAQECLHSLDFINKRHEELLSDRTWTLFATGKKSQQNLTALELQTIKANWLRHGRFSNFSSPALVYLTNEIFPALHEQFTNALNELNKKQKKVPYDFYTNYHLWLENCIKILELHRHEIIVAMIARLQVASHKNDLEFDDVTWQTMYFLNQKVLDNPCQLPKPRKTLTADCFNYFHKHIFSHGTTDDKAALMKLKWFSKSSHHKNPDPIDYYLERLKASSEETKESKPSWTKRKMRFITKFFDDLDYQKKFLQSRYYTLSCFNLTCSKINLNHLNNFSDQPSIKLITLQEFLLADEHKMLSLELKYNSFLQTGFKKSKRNQFLSQWNFFLDSQHEKNITARINILNEIALELKKANENDPLFKLQINNITRMEIEKFIIVCLKNVFEHEKISKKQNLPEKFLPQINNLLIELSRAELFDIGRLLSKLSVDIKSKIDTIATDQTNDIRKIAQQLRSGQHLKHFEIEYFFEYVEGRILSHTDHEVLKNEFKIIVEPILTTALSKIKDCFKNNNKKPLNAHGMEEYCREILYWADIINKIYLCGSDYKLNFNNSCHHDLFKLLTKFLIAQRNFVHATLSKRDLDNTSLVSIEKIMSLIQKNPMITQVQKILVLRQNIQDNTADNYQKLYDELTTNAALWLSQERFNKELNRFDNSLFELVKIDPSYKRYTTAKTLSILQNTRNKMVAANETNPKVYAYKLKVPLTERRKTLLGFYPQHQINFIRTWLQLSSRAHLAKNEIEINSRRKNPSLHKVNSIVKHLNESIAETAREAKKIGLNTLTPDMETFVLDRFGQSKFFKKTYFNAQETYVSNTKQISQGA